MFLATEAGSKGKDPAGVLVGRGCIAWGQVKSTVWLLSKCPLGTVGVPGIGGQHLLGVPKGLFSSAMMQTHHLGALV